MTFKISVVIPVYNEDCNLEVLVEKLSEVLGCFKDYELVFVDDGSSDQTLELLKTLSLSNDNIVYISFSRNFGHQNALRAGLGKSTGNVVITMDGDLQHPPTLIPSMVDKWIAGYDIVYTLRNDNQNVSFLKKTTSAFFYKFLNRVADIDLKQGCADFRLMDRKVVDVLKQFNESAIFYRGLVSWLGFSKCELAYKPEKRFQGKSKYTYKKMLGLALDGISSFSFFPLRLAAFTGVLVGFVSFLIVIYALYVKLFTGDAVSGWVSIMAGIYFLGGIQLMFLGMFGEYIGRIFMEVKSRPNYVISETNLDANLHSRSDRKYIRK